MCHSSILHFMLSNFARDAAPAVQKDLRRFFGEHRARLAAAHLQPHLSVANSCGMFALPRLAACLISKLVLFPNVQQTASCGR